MKALVRCANGCDSAPCPPSLVICRACLDEMGRRFTLLAAGKRLPACSVAESVRALREGRCPECGGDNPHSGGCA